MAARSHLGFTLIELLVAATIAVILLLLAMPGYTVWVADNEIRNGTESVASGLRYAQQIAISRNLSTQFVLGATGWTVAMVDAPLVPIQTATFAEGSSNRATFTGTNAVTTAVATTIAFNALGQAIANPANLTQIDVAMPGLAGTRSLRVIAGDLASGKIVNGVKICDPAFPATDPKGCPT